MHKKSPGLRVGWIHAAIGDRPGVKDKHGRSGEGHPGARINFGRYNISLFRTDPLIESELKGRQKIGISKEEHLRSLGDLREADFPEPNDVNHYRAQV